MKSDPPAAGIRQAEFECSISVITARCGPWPMPGGWMPILLSISPKKHSCASGNTGRPAAKNFKIRAWLLRVARNLAEDYAKSAFRRNGTQPPALMNGVTSHDPQPLDKLEREESFAQLREILEQMPQGDREILTLRYTLDYDAQQIAEVLGINATAVHMRLSRARQRLADRLTAEGIQTEL